MQAGVRRHHMNMMLPLLLITLSGCKPSNNQGNSPWMVDREYFIAEGPFDPAKGEAFYEAQLERHSPHVAELNEAHSKAFNRRNELEKAVNANDVGSAAALAELRELNADYPDDHRDAYMQLLDDEIKQLEARLADIEETQQKLTNKPSTPAREQEILELEKKASHLAFDIRLANDLRRRTNGGYIGTVSKRKSPADLQEKFFPAYNP
jgi:chromosome segregation ATPase